MHTYVSVIGNLTRDITPNEREEQAEKTEYVQGE